MQSQKNKKVIIASIAILLLALVVIIILVVRNSSSGGNTEEDGSVLVDTLDKGGDYETKVYITKNNHLLMRIKNARYINLVLQDEKEPVADTYVETEMGSYDIGYGIIFNLNNVINENSDEANVYPCECELSLISVKAGIEYTIKLKIDEDIEYISGEQRRVESDKTAIAGYEDFAKKYGEITLPEKAVIKSLETKKGVYQIGDDTKAIEQGECTYILDGKEANLNIMSSSNQDLLDYVNQIDGVRKLSVKGTDVSVAFESSMYVAFFKQGDYIYANFVGYSNGSKLKDSELIERLEGFIK